VKLKRIILSLVLVPLAVILVVFIIANRGMVSIHFNPFDLEDAYWRVRAPLFVFLFVFLSLGVVVGSLVTWIGQHKYRKKLKKIEGMTDID